MTDEIIDTDLVTYLQRLWGPFHSKLETARDGTRYKCDFCGRAFEKIIVSQSQRDTEKVAYACMGECGQVFLGDAAYQLLFVLELEKDKGVIKVAPGEKEAAKEILEAEEELARLNPYHPRQVAEIVKKSFNYQKAGFGKKWPPIVSDIIMQYHHRGRLSDKQVDVLIKFCRSCKDEVNHV